jgi:hypothetical protein
VSTLAPSHPHDPIIRLIQIIRDLLVAIALEYTKSHPNDRAVTYLTQTIRRQLDAALDDLINPLVSAQAPSPAPESPMPDAQASPIHPKPTNHHAARPNPRPHNTIKPLNPTQSTDPRARPPPFRVHQKPHPAPSSTHAHFVTISQ